MQRHHESTPLHAGHRHQVRSCVYLTVAATLALCLLGGTGLTYGQGAVPATATLSRRAVPVTAMLSRRTALVPHATTLLGLHNARPLRFEPNRGQSAATVRFLAHDGGSAVFLTDNAAVLAVAQAAAIAHSATSHVISHLSPAVPRFKRQLAVLSLLGANPHPQVIGLDRLPGVSNYLHGNDPHRWYRDIPAYARVEYRNVYPGVNVIYSGQSGQLVYDIVVMPGARPAAVRVSVTGAQRLRLDSRGNVVLRGTGLMLLQARPVAYQNIDGTRRLIASHYLLTGGHQLAIGLSSYDTTRPLIIGPTLSYATYIGGGESDSGNGIAADVQGNAYVTGYTASTDFMTTTMLQTANAGDDDAFVTKLDPNGALVYSTYLGGSGTDEGNGIAVDSSGAAYVTGWTSSTNFPVHLPVREKNAGGDDVFVARLDPAGDALAYSTYLGGSGSDGGEGIAVDSSGAAYVTGWTNSTDFQPTLSPLAGASPAGNTAFVVKLDPSGAVAYGVSLAGTVQGNDIAVDGTGAAYVTGWTNSSTFLGTATFGGDDAFVAKLSPGGNALVYGRDFGGSGTDQGNGIAVDSSGAAYVTGWSNSSDFQPALSPLAGASQGSDTAFVVKLDPGGTVAYSVSLGGSGSNGGNSIAVDSTGAAYITGWTNSTNFPMVNPVPGQEHAQGDDDAFVAELNAAGSALLYSTYLGGSGTDEGNGIALDGAMNAYVVGSTNSANFPMVAALRSTCSCADNSDGFVAKVGGASTPPPAATIYFAEGYTGRLATNGIADFDEYISVLNPANVTRTITFTYELQGQSMPIVYTVQAGPNRVVQRHVNSDVGDDQIVSTIVSASDPAPIAAERVINRTTQGGLLDSTSSLGTTSTGRRWYFAEGYTGLTFQEYLTVLNPRALPAQVQVTFLPQDTPADTPQSISFTVPATSRATENIRRAYLAFPGNPGKSVGMIVTSDQPIVAERVLYWGNGYGSGKFGADTMPGFTRAGELVYFAYSSTTGDDPANATSPTQRVDDRSFITIGNPNPVTGPAAQVQISFADATGRPSGSTSIQVYPQTRRTVTVADTIAPVQGPFSTIVRSDQPVIVEKPQYMGGSPNEGQHPGFSQLAATPGSMVLFPALHTPASASASFSETVFLLNTGTTPINVTGTYYSSGGQTATASHVVPPGQIVPVDLNADAGSLPDGVWGAMFASTTGQLVAASVGQSPDGAAYIGDQGVTVR